MDPSQPEYWGSFELLKLQPQMLISISDLLSPGCKTALRQACKISREAIKLPCVIVAASLNIQGELSPLPVRHLPTADTAHKCLILSMHSSASKQTEANLRHSISSRLQSLQGFNSIEVTGPSWSLEAVMHELTAPAPTAFAAAAAAAGSPAATAAAAAAAAASKSLSSVTSLTIVNNGPDKQYMRFSKTLATIICQAPKLTSLTVNGLEMDLGVLSQLCNSMPLLRTVTVKCNKWRGDVVLHHVQQLHFVCNTKSQKMSLAPLCFVQHSLPAVKHISLTHVDPESWGLTGFPEGDGIINRFLQCVIPICPRLEGVFLACHDHYRSEACIDRSTFAALASASKLQHLRVGGLELGAAAGMVLSSLTHLSVKILQAEELSVFAPGIVCLHVGELLARGDDDSSQQQQLSEDNDDNPMFWHDNSLSDCLSPSITHLSVNQNILPKLGPLITHLRVEVSDCDSLDTSGYPLLQSIHIVFNWEDAYEYTSQNLADVLQSLQQHQHLTHLCLDSYEVGDSLTNLIPLTNVTHLQLERVSINSLQLQQCITDMPNLVHISVRFLEEEGWTFHDGGMPDADERRRIQRNNSRMRPLPFRLQIFDSLHSSVSQHAPVVSG